MATRFISRNIVVRVWFPIPTALSIDQPIEPDTRRQPTATLNGCHVAIVCYIKRYAVSRATPDAYLIT